MTGSRLLTATQLQGYSHPALAKVVKPVFVCPICGKHHPDRIALQACMASSEKPVAKAGDIVVISNGFTWRDGQDDWLYDQRGGKFHDKPMVRFWYVITAVTQRHSSRRSGPDGDQDAHRIIYHVQTLGLFNGMSEGHHGWTHPKTHTSFIKPDRLPPQSVIDSSKKMVGRVFDNLL